MNADREELLTDQLRRRLECDRRNMNPKPELTLDSIALRHGLKVDDVTSRYEALQLATMEPEP